MAWWEVVSGPITGAIFIPLSQSSCFVLAGSIRSGIVGSVLPCPRQQAIQAFLTGARHMAPDSPSGSRSSRLRNTCGLARCQFFGGGTHMTTKKLSVWQCVCIHADEVYDLVCCCGMTEGPRVGELFQHDLQQKKVQPLCSSRAVFEFSTRFEVGLSTLCCCFYNREIFKLRIIKMLNRERHEGIFFELPP